MQPANMVTHFSTAISEDDKASSSVYSRHRAQRRAQQSRHHL